MFGAILLCILICVYAVWAYNVDFKHGHKLPPLYPGWIPIIGHLHVLVGDGYKLWRTIQNITEESLKNGGVICLLLGNRIYYFITDPDDALTACNACLQKHFSYDFAKSWLGNGLITASGETWKRHRKLLTPAFSLPVTYGFLDIFNSQSRKLVNNLKQEVGKPFDQSDHLRYFSLETFCLTAFGISGFDDKNFINKYMLGVDNILKIMTSRFTNFWLQNELIFKVTGLKKKLDRFSKIANDMSDKVIQKKRAALSSTDGKYVTKASGVIYKPLLDLLLELSEDNALTDREIREEVDTGIVTGFDTTSNLMCYILLLLGTHTQVQEKMYKEIEEVFDKTDRDVAKDDLQKLIYTDAVIKESLRVFATGPLTLRSVDKDVKLRNYTMRAGSTCVVLFDGPHNDPMWGKDVKKFRPERWLEEMPTNPSAFAGFSLGKRSCLGKTYAMMTMKVTLVHILRNYKISADDSNLKVRFDFLLRPTSGHEICLEERQKAVIPN